MPHLAQSVPGPRPCAAPASALEIFLTFAGISMQAFGGALGLVERTIVQRKRWLTATEFVELFAVSQVLPGPSGVALAVLLGERFMGWRGALAAVSGLLLLPAAVVLGVAALFQRYAHLAAVQGALDAMGAASAGLVTVTAARMARSLRGQLTWACVALASFVMAGLLRLPVMTIMCTLGMASVGWAWHQGRKRP